MTSARCEDELNRQSKRTGHDRDLFADEDEIDEVFDAGTLAIIGVDSRIGMNLLGHVPLDHHRRDQERRESREGDEILALDEVVRLTLVGSEADIEVCLLYTSPSPRDS